MAVYRLRRQLEADPSRARVVGNLGQGYFLGWSPRVEGRGDQPPG